MVVEVVEVVVVVEDELGAAMAAGRASIDNSSIEEATRVIA